MKFLTKVFNRIAWFFLNRKKKDEKTSTVIQE